MGSIDGRLHRGVEILHTDRHAIDASVGEGVRLQIAQVARVDFDGELGGDIDFELVAQRGSQSADVLWIQNVGRSAAPMDMGDVSAFGQLCSDVGDLDPQRFEVGLNRLLAPRRLCTATAIPAKVLAEGNMQIERKADVLGQL